MGVVFPFEKNPKRKKKLLAKELGVPQDKAEEILDRMKKAREEKGKEFRF